MTRMMAAAICFVGSSASARAASGSGQACAAESALGCFRDPYTASGSSHRVLSHQAAAADPAMTPSKCVALCCKAGYKPGALAGTEGGGACWCGHSLGPYTIPKANNCNISCTGSRRVMCGGAGALSAMTITHCPAYGAAPWQSPNPLVAAPPALQSCGAAGCTSCPKGDLCCKGKAPDSYKVPGGFGCSPPTPPGFKGCASGGDGKNAGLPSGRCCCGPGPSMGQDGGNASLPNVLVIGDSVRAPHYTTDNHSA
jgi:hypothetical protein